jgi:hypothetical protein
MPATPTDVPARPRVPAGAAPGVPRFDRAIAAVGHVVRAGRWALPPRFRAVAWMGGVDLDLTDAVLPPGGADLELLAVLGVVTVRVPAGLAVEVVGDAITWDADAAAALAWGTPGGVRRAAVRVTGRAVLGKVHIAVAPARPAAAG